MNFLHELYQSKWYVLGIANIIGLPISWEPKDQLHTKIQNLTDKNRIKATNWTNEQSNELSNQRENTLDNSIQKVA